MEVKKAGLRASYSEEVLKVICEFVNFPLMVVYGGGGIPLARGTTCTWL